jgi:hypothetical protein
MEKVKYNSKSKSGYFNDDTLDHFVWVARQDGWDVMLKEAWNFVKTDCEWNDDDERWHITRVLLNEVGYELTRSTRMD